MKKSILSTIMMVIVLLSTSIKSQNLRIKRYDNRPDITTIIPWEFSKFYPNGIPNKKDETVLNMYLDSIGTQYESAFMVYYSDEKHLDECQMYVLFADSTISKFENVDRNNMHGYTEFLINLENREKMKSMAILGFWFKNDIEYHSYKLTDLSTRKYFLFLNSVLNHRG